MTPSTQDPLPDAPDTGTGPVRPAIQQADSQKVTVRWRLAAIVAAVPAECRRAAAARGA